LIFSCRTEQAQVAGYGVLQGKQASDSAVDLHLKLVDAGFTAKHLLCLLFVTFYQGANARVNGRFNEAGHLQQTLL
jgi:hypothetical protein